MTITGLYRDSRQHHDICGQKVERQLHIEQNLHGQPFGQRDSPRPGCYSMPCDGHATQAWKWGQHLVEVTIACPS